MFYCGSQLWLLCLLQQGLTLFAVVRLICVQTLGVRVCVHVVAFKWKSSFSIGEEGGQSVQRESGADPRGHSRPAKRKRE